MLRSSPHGEVSDREFSSVFKMSSQTIRSIVVFSHNYTLYRANSWIHVFLQSWLKQISANLIN